MITVRQLFSNIDVDGVGEFYSLYGHLSVESLQELAVGMTVRKGQPAGNDWRLFCKRPVATTLYIFRSSLICSITRATFPGSVQTGIVRCG